MRIQQLTFLFVAIMAAATAVQAQKKDEINFSEPIQVERSEYFMIPRMIDSENHEAYGKGKGQLPWGAYSQVYFYNAATGQIKKLFNSLALINSFGSRRHYYEPVPAPDTPRNFLPMHIIYLARTENFNGDNGLDSEDPQYLFISTRSGDQLRQVTPTGFNVISWTVSADKKIILVKLQNDKNGNRKFGTGDDEVYYRIDLHEDVNAITCEPLNIY